VLPELHALAHQFHSGHEAEAFIRSHFLYRAESRETLRAPRRMLVDLDNGALEGDCDDISIFAAALLSAMGIRNRFVAIRYGGSPEFLHVFVEWWSNAAQLWVRLDPTVRPGLIHQEDERLILDVL
jgi:transglutaminase-like putative cysteine protease